MPSLSKFASSLSPALRAMNMYGVDMAAASTTPRSNACRLSDGSPDGKNLTSRSGTSANLLRSTYLTIASRKAPGRPVATVLPFNSSTVLISGLANSDVPTSIGDRRHHDLILDADNMRRDRAGRRRQNGGHFTGGKQLLGAHTPGVDRF